MNIQKDKLRKRFLIVCFIFIIIVPVWRAQILTSSPYSRYGFGELNLPTFASSAGFGGSFIAYQQEDSIAPFFINVANPAGLAGLRLSTFEVGGQGQFTTISNQTASVKKKNVNFSYGTIGFPLKRIGGMAFGIMPYSTVGYKINSTEEDANIGTINYVFQGDGGINKVFLGTGIKPFRRQALKFYNSALADTLIKYQQTAKYKRIKFSKQLLSELSIGVIGNYLFGTINNTTDVIYPGSITYYNAKRQRATQINDFTCNGGIQTHFIIDSVKSKQGKRILKEKIKIGFGAFVNTPMTINAKQSTIIYNYSLDGFGNETPKDTALNSQNNAGTITLPIEFGFGLSVKKGERLTVLVDAAMTQWKEFKYFNTPNTDFRNTYRVSAGLNYVPNKIIRGFSNYHKRVQYRLGASYSDGYLDIKNTAIANAFVSAGLGLPVGFGRLDDEIGMVNIAVQYGKNGTLNNNLLKEDFIRLVVGFTFNKRWFIKYKYD
ncbi:MAG: hypothetical protein IT251_08900 [Chitinophagaceae bacterium]|nr:hypothetical protein [Chitinophagaceae bacterium]